MSACWKLICPHYIDEVEDDDQAKDKYDDYQSFLSTVMTIGTLLLGFILTGTLLNYNYQGDLRRSHFAVPFDRVSGLASAFATVSVMMSLLVSVRASVIFRNNGPRKALRAMRNSTLCMGVAELSIYVSVNFFFISVLMYLWWAQKGPSEICKDQRGAAADCPMMAADLRAAGIRMCRIFRMPSDPCDYEPCRTQSMICGFYSRREQGQEELFFHTWAEQFHVDGALQMVHLLASESCRREQLADIADKLCDTGELRDELAMKACASANTDALAAAECTDDTIHLAATCSNVCSQNQRYDLWWQLNVFGAPGTFVLGAVVVIRAIKIGQQVHATWQYHVATSTRPWFSILREAGILDTFSSSEEEPSELSHQYSRAAMLADGREDSA